MILTHPNPILSLVSEPATPFEAIVIVEKLKSALAKSGGVGLAAPQIGLLRRVIIVRPVENIFAFVNPVIVGHSKRMVRSVEGCLSVPGRTVAIQRYTSVTIQHANGTTQCHGLMARIVQHEIDHLDGVLILGREIRAS
jgi:peptide deformylase